jgi:hypothetical protein
VSYQGIDGVLRIYAESIVRVESQFDDQGIGKMLSCARRQTSMSPRYWREVSGTKVTQQS